MNHEKRCGCYTWACYYEDLHEENWLEGDIEFPLKFCPWCGKELQDPKEK